MNQHGGAQDTLGDTLRRAARKHRDRPALAFRDRTWTFEELYGAAQSVGANLLARGLNPGDRVAACGRNTDAYFIAWLGCAAAGLVHVPVNFGLTAEEVSYIVRQSGARAMLCDAERLPLMRSIPEADRLSFVGTFEGDQEFDVLAAARRGDALAAPPIRGDDLAQLQYTSGTTAAPKGAMVTHRGLFIHYLACIHDLDFEARDRCLAALPLYHTAQTHAYTMPQTLSGAMTRLIQGPEPERVFEIVAAERINSFFAPPTVWISLLRHPAFDSYDLSSLEKVYYGASIMPVPVLEELRRRLPNAGLYNVYGQTEVGPVATVLRPEEHEARPASAGRPVITVETRIVDEHLHDVPAGTLGEIVHRSPQLLVGYWERPDETEAAFRGGWFHSGDLGYADAEGYIYVVDRVRDVINTGGVLVASREVEEALFSHPAVSEAAVIALPDPKWIEAVVAVVVLRQGMEVEAATLIEHVRGRLAAHKAPKRVIFADSLPRNASGKILKRELRQQHS
ncbi:MAG TPA: fatty acyl-CoA synthetase [Phenylobacterium sp.]|uniref:fatty acyl-CoA synthetase n=1 Tax=Phenylobacterium sp. TaxID=1871053 RepID=UPI002B4851E3|nr:fatty acyl-CoA synthetase [Phenylobacterium sp.]HKR88257.1 fatty acyl-CoA synthetase [Phenylobacterium sp.]